MASRLKTFALQMIAGANVVSVILMLFIGFSDRLDPRVHPLLANIGLSFPLFLLICLGFMVFFLFTHKKYALISLIGFVIGYSPIHIYCPLNIGREQPEESIKILSYNVHNFDSTDAPEDDPNPILSYILDSNADIVCLQEAFINDDIRSSVNKHYAYVDTVMTNDRSNSLAVMSKYPIISKEKIEYVSKRNLSAAFKLKISHDTVVVINNHFEVTGLSPSDRSGFSEMVKGQTEGSEVRAESKRLLVILGESMKIRAPQIDAVAKYVDNISCPTVLCGDFNDNPLSYSRKTLADRLTDCYVSSGFGPGISYNRHGMFVRIDNIMCSDDWTAYRCKVDRSISYSDHYPIYCWLKSEGRDKKY
ncbi:MAG: endonuclease/exonuclease/phosphatase family protein [Prevotella sp.]